MRPGQALSGGGYHFSFSALIYPTIGLSWPAVGPVTHCDGVPSLGWVALRPWSLGFGCTRLAGPALAGGEQMTVADKVHAAFDAYRARLTPRLARRKTDAPD